MTLRWDRCILQKGQRTAQFINEFFSDTQRRVLLIGGAGFDPRATQVARLFAPATGPRLDALLLRERRPNPDEALLQRAKNNIHVLSGLITDPQVVDVQIFAPDGAVIGGREGVNVVRSHDLRAYTDIAVDASALSRGVIFPVVRYLLQVLPCRVNLHLFVTDDPVIDAEISTLAWDQPGYVHGFKGDTESANDPLVAKLWLPQLVAGEKGALQRIHRFIAPHDVCPILPFPARDPKAPDKLIERFADELRVWDVDPRNIIFADESNPLDVYRAIVRIGDARRDIFAGTIGSRIVLSPVGSKVLSLGAMMAAIERDFPVVYVEAVAYKISTGSSLPANLPVLHLWLQGQAYEEQAAS